jgi:hypothetical protein
VVCSVLESHRDLCISEQSPEDSPSMTEHVMGAVTQVQPLVGVAPAALFPLLQEEEASRQSAPHCASVKANRLHWACQEK